MVVSRRAQPSALHLAHGKLGTVNVKRMRTYRVVRKTLDRLRELAPSTVASSQNLANVFGQHCAGISTLTRITSA